MKKTYRFLGVAAALIMAANANAGGQKQANCDAVCPGTVISMQTKAARGGELFSILKEIIVDQLGVNEELVTMEAIFASDLGADSLDMFELCIRCEEEFEIEISDELRELIVDVGDLYDIIVISWTH